ncbi:MULTISPECIES: amidase [unclassified Acidiphilium]|uniref:amidase n=1 Tax=unclassified Acidiphilium TaxID=2617493 RepID=UPI000BD9C13A|nr:MULTISPECIES: amidase family protein [unclassified Acidiphilium]OYV54721.1 MAG: amidase [Acidiphilium sp. 20-67-58]HQT62641.1 amidase family protein [Acidiphilium sp.]
MTDPCDLPATEARRLIGSRKLSPVDLTESCIARIERVDHAVNAMVARDFTRARAAARTAEAAVMAGNRLPPLHGLPLGVKDLEDTEGLRTTYGSLMFKDNIPKADQGFIATIRAAGGIVLGKTNTPEFGAGGNTRNLVYGATGNPFDFTKSAAGSSGGSAVALATGMVPLATGSDMGGSLRNPASFCGIVGMRPSPGLFPSEKRLLGPSGLSVLGPMARSVADLALMFDATASYDTRDMLSAPASADEAASRAAADLGTLRAAFTPDFGFAPTSRQTRALFADRAARLAPLFASAEDASPDCRHADETFAILRAVNFLASFGATYRTAPERLGPNVRANVEEGMGYTAADVARALHAQTALYWAWQHFFLSHDVLIAPAVTIQPRKWTELFPSEIDGTGTKSYFHWLALAYAVTLAGHPSLCLPLGTDEDGMPFGVQIIGRRHGDRAVIEVAKAIEAIGAATGPELTRPVPDIAKLAAAAPISGMDSFLAMG